MKRPSMLPSTTYKMKMGNSPAVYCTISDIKDDQGVVRPFEVFLNTKSLQHVAHLTAMTRVLSAVLRNDPDPSYLVEELMSVQDPEGGAFVDGQHCPSIYAYIAIVLEQHLRELHDQHGTVFKFLPKHQSTKEKTP